MITNDLANTHSWRVLQKISNFFLFCSTFGMSGISLSNDNGHFYKQKQMNKTRAVEMETLSEVE